MNLRNGDDSSIHVCSVTILRGFGECSVGGYTSDDIHYEGPPVAEDYEGFIELLKKRANQYNRVYPLAKNAMVVAYATTLQPKAQEYLRKAGFEEFKVSRYGKYRHGISQFTIRMSKFLKLVDIKPDPNDDREHKSDEYYYEYELELERDTE